MRFLKSALPLIGAAAILAGCMGGLNSGSVPATGGTSAMSSISHSGGVGPALKSQTVTPDTTCPSTYYACALTDASTPYYAEWCVSNTGNCSSGLVGTWTWSAAVTNVKNGKPAKKNPSAVWSPDPGNPSTLTISSKNKKIGKHPKIRFAVALTACSSSYGCFSNFATYGDGW